MELLNPNSYQKGGWVLHMLRRQLGDSLFWKGIQTYYSRYSGKNAVTGDLCKVMEEVSGAALQPFFQQWLFRAGHPKLNITWQYNSTKKEVSVTVVQLQNELFQFPLELQIGNNGIKQVAINNRETTFTFSAATRPAAITVDPNVNLLYEGSIKEVNK
jgi:aminopeptidase N